MAKGKKKRRNPPFEFKETPVLSTPALDNTSTATPRYSPSPLTYQPGDLIYNQGGTATGNFTGTWISPAYGATITFTLPLSIEVRLPRGDTLGLYPPYISANFERILGLALLHRNYPELLAAYDWPDNRTTMDDAMTIAAAVAKAAPWTAYQIDVDEERQLWATILMTFKYAERSVSMLAGPALKALCETDNPARIQLYTAVVGAIHGQLDIERIKLNHYIAEHQAMAVFP